MELTIYLVRKGKIAYLGLAILIIFMAVKIMMNLWAMRVMIIFLAIPGTIKFGEMRKAPL